MAINFTQTNTSGGVCSSDAAYCSGGTNGTGGTPRLCSDGGSTGSLSTDATIGGLVTRVVGIFTIDVAAGVAWNSGTWTVRLNCNAANMNLTLDSVHLCRVNSSCTNQASIGSATSQGISLSTTGVKTVSVTGSAQTPGVGDRIVVVVGIINGAMTSQATSFTADQNIDSPFTVFVPRSPYMLSQAVKRASVY